MNQKITKIVNTAAFSAVALIISLISVPLPFLPTFLKIDLSLVIALLVGKQYGLKSAVLVEVFKNILSILLIGSNTSGIGELANLVIELSFVITYFKLSSLKYRTVFAILMMSIVGCLLNYYGLIPLYSYVLGIEVSQLVAANHQIMPWINNLFTLVVLGVAPFNLLKGIIVSSCCNLISKHIK